MALGVLLDSLVRVNGEQDRLGAGGAGDHVLEKLDVSRSVNEDVAALLRLEEAAGGVNGDPLCLLVLERIQQEGVLEWAGVAAAHLANLLQLALGQRAGLREEAADNRALAVVNMADDDDVHLGVVGGAHGEIPGKCG